MNIPKVAYPVNCQRNSLMIKEKVWDDGGVSGARTVKVTSIFKNVPKILQKSKLLHILFFKFQKYPYYIAKNSRFVKLVILLSLPLSHPNLTNYQDIRTYSLTI